MMCGEPKGKKSRNHCFNGERIEFPIFDFGMEAISTIIKELEQADEYIKIAMFQIHRDDVFRVLHNKIRQGVGVEILTLPYDSIHEEIRSRVQSSFESLEKDGAAIYLCKWNVGDPERTTTAVGRWYSFHGKFIVTDKSAIALSANFTENPELDAVLVYRGDREKINKFNRKFARILSLFVTKEDGFEGKIHRMIMDVVSGKESAGIFRLPSNVDEKHKDHWIRHYPVKICEFNPIITEGLFITPFDCTGRDFINGLIEEAEEYVYLSTESFTDTDFSDSLVSTAVNRGIEIKILTGIRSMDFTDRVNRMLRDLLAQEIKINTTEEDLHAKLILTDKSLAISSINLNRMNLGFHKTKKFWRENTETIFVCRKAEAIRSAKEKYLERFGESYDVGNKLAEKLESLVKDTFMNTFGLRSSSEAKKLFARFILNKQIDIRKMIVKIGKLTQKLMIISQRKIVTKEDVVSALVLYCLSERKHDYDQLRERLAEIAEGINLRALLNKLKFARLIEQEDDFYKINVEALIS